MCAVERLEQSESTFLRLVSILKNNKKNRRDTTLVMGAGCSLSSSISPLTTTSIIREFMKGFADHKEVCDWPNDRLWAEFTRYWDNIGHRERFNYLSERLSSVTPGPGYGALAHLIDAGYISRIVTTNFDLLLDHALSHLTARFIVGDAPPEVRGSGNPIIEVLKVHGDISRLSDGVDAPLRFSPCELDILPVAITNSIHAATSVTTLVIGYSGADRGFVQSLAVTPDATAFWVLPDYFSSVGSYTGNQMMQWLGGRNGINNIIEGPRYGYFDPFMEELSVRLLMPRPSSHRDHTFLPGRWLDTLPSRMLDRNHHLKYVATIFLDLIEEACQGASWEQYTPPFAFSSEDLCRAVALVFREVATETVFSDVPQNEADGLLLLLAAEIRSRSAQIDLAASDILNIVEHYFARRHESYLPHPTFWRALRYLVEESEQEVPPDRLEMWLNCDRRLTLIVNSTPLVILRDHLDVLDVLRILNTPLSTISTVLSPVASLHAAFQTTASEPKTEDGSIRLELRGLTRAAFRNVFDVILAHLPGSELDSSGEYVSSKYVEVVLLAGDLDPLRAKGGQSQLLEVIEARSRETCDNFLSRAHPLNLPSINPVERPHDAWIKRFLESYQVATILGGMSGSGKSESVSRLIRQEKAKRHWLPIIVEGALLSQSDLLTEMFPELPHASEEPEVLARLAAAVMSRDQRLLLVIDGLNEASAEPLILLKIWEKVLFLTEIINRLEGHPIKLMLTCREGTLRTLSQRSVPPEPFFYFPTDVEDCEEFWIPVHPLRPKEIEEICSRVLKRDPTPIMAGFRADPAIFEIYSRPILLLAALHSLQEKEDAINPPSLSPRWAVANLCGTRLVEGLPDEEDRKAFFQLLDIAFSETLENPAHKNRNFGFAIRKLYGRAGRIQYEDLLRKLRDVGLIVAPPSNVLGDFRFTHDLVEEYFLGVFMKRRFEDNFNFPLSRCLADDYFGNGLRIMLLSTDDHADSAKPRHAFVNIIWYLRDNSDGSEDLPAIVASVLEHRVRPDLDVTALFSDLSHDHYQDIRRMASFLLMGMAHLLEKGKSIVPERLGEALNASLDGTAGLNDILAELSLSRSYCAYRQDQFSQALDFAVEASRRLTGLVGDDYGLWDRVEQQRGSLLAKLGDKAEGILVLRTVYDRRKALGLFRESFDNGLELGAVLRDFSRFQEALGLYGEMAAWSGQVSDLQNNRLLLQRGTALKNLLQEKIEPYRYKDDRDILSVSQDDYFMLFEQAIADIEEAEHWAEESGAVQFHLTCISEKSECLLVMAYVQPSLLPECESVLSYFENALAFHDMVSRRIEYYRERARLEEIKGEQSSIGLTKQEEYRKTTFAWLVKARTLAEEHGLAYQVAEANYQISKYALRSLRQTGRPSFYHEGRKSIELVIEYFTRNGMDGRPYMRGAQIVLAQLLEEAVARELVFPETEGFRDRIPKNRG